MAKHGICKRACNFLQLYARLLETDENGYRYCCSCGQMTTWENGHGGHYQAKGRHYNAAAFEEDNVHYQCATCNTYRQGNNAGYAQYMLRELGVEVIEYIKQQSYKTLENEEIREIARIYKQKCKDLAKTKNFKVTVPT